MELRVLGPLEVLADGREVPLGGPQQRALLARLLVDRGRTVPADRLVDDLWGEDVPASAAKMVQVRVSQLRKVLPAGVLRTSAPGYVLDVEAGAVDVVRFERLRDAGRAAVRAGDPAAGAERFTEALELWRGPALAGIGEPFARAEAARLEEARLVCVEDRVDAALACGRHADVIGELEALVAAHPERSRLCAQLMIALYRTGRHGDALAAFRANRDRLDEELGLAPPADLRELEQRILVQDPALGAAPAAPPAEPAEPAAGGVFVGRERELARVDAALAGVAAGRGHVLALGGEPGIGKTRLAVEAQAAARRRGARVVWGRCHEREGAPPYWPWAQALRALAAGERAAVLAQELGDGAGDVAALVPAFAHAGAPGERGDPHQARFRLFDAVVALLAADAAHDPVVVVLDDVQWADADSLLLLEFVAREVMDARVLLLVAYRDAEVSRGHPLTRTLAELRRCPGFEQIGLGGLSEEATAAFIARAGEPGADERHARAVHARTHGNPLFIGEVVRLLGEDPQLTRIPDGVREVIGRRLERLSPRVTELLEPAAVLGRRWDVPELVALGGGDDPAAVLEALEEAVEAGVVTAAGDDGKHDFAHALFAEAIVAGLPASRRAALHLRIARALEARGDAIERAAELAHHYAGARALTGTAPLVRWSRVAGEHALAAHAHEDAAAIFARALDARRGEPLDDAAADLHFGLGRAQLAIRELRDLGEAFGNLTCAFDHYAAAGDVDRALAVATHPLPPHLLYEPAGVADLMQRALALARPGSVEAGQLLAFLGWLRGIDEGDRAGARSAFDGALEIARRRADATLETKALLNAQYVEMFHLRWEDCLAAGRRAAELSVRTGDARSEMAARGWMSRALCVLGRPNDAVAQAAVTLETADRLRDRYWKATSRLHNAVPAALTGDWETACRHTDLAFAARPQDARTIGVRAYVEHQRGDLDAGRAMLERLQALVESVPPPGPGADYPLAAAFLPLCDRVAGTAEHHAAARVIAEKLLALERRTPYLTTCAQIGLGLIAAAEGDAVEAGRLREELLRNRSPMFLLPPLSADRLLGILAAAAGLHDAAVGHLEAAVAWCSRVGYLPEARWAASDLAAVTPRLRPRAPAARPRPARPCR